MEQPPCRGPCLWSQRLSHGVSGPVKLNGVLRISILRQQDKSLQAEVKAHVDSISQGRRRANYLLYRVQTHYRA